LLWNEFGDAFDMEVWEKNQTIRLNAGVSRGGEQAQVAPPWWVDGNSHNEFAAGGAR